ncbi:unnamed protein product [Hyaloperonospora brassicae]|nr:unnamed protein product [Hyaloperonospora brassicae]
MMKKGGEQLSVAEDTEVAVIEKMDDTDLIKEIGVASDTNDAENVASDAEVTGADEKAEEASKVEEAKMGDVETAEIGETKAEEAEEAAKMEEMTEGTDLLEVATKVEETEITDVDEETAVRVELEAPEAAKVEAAADIDVALKTEVKQAEAKETEVKQTESKKTVVTEEVVRKTDVTEVTESTDHTEEAAAVFETVSKDEVEQTEVVTDRKTETETVEISEAFDTTEEAEKGTTSSSVKEVEVALTFINEARATAEPDDVVHLNEDDGCAQVGEEVEEMVTSAKEEESEEVATNEVGETAEADKVIQEATIEEVQQVRFTRDSAVQVVVERQTFGDMLSTAQHAHWLSLPVSANPALARLHSVLSDHDLLTAYALYPSNSSSSSGSDEDESLPHIPTSKPFAAT